MKPQSFPEAPDSSQIIQQHPVISALKKLWLAFRIASIAVELLGEGVTVPKPDAQRVWKNHEEVLGGCAKRISAARQELAALGYDMPERWTNVTTFVDRHVNYHLNETVTITMRGWSLDKLRRASDEVSGAMDVAVGKLVAGQTSVPFKTEGPKVKAGRRRRTAAAIPASEGIGGRNSAEPEATRPVNRPEHKPTAGGDNLNGKTSLSPSRVKAKALYDWALSVIPGSTQMTIAEIYRAVCGRLDVEIARSHGQELEKLQELKDTLPPNPAAFGRYLRDAGVKRYDKTGNRRPNRSVRGSHEI